jgi:hypothetical protein
MPNWQGQCNWNWIARLRSRRSKVKPEWQQSNAQEPTVPTFCFFAATGRFGAPVPNTGFWSLAGAHFGEMVATKPTVDPYVRMPGLEDADPKVDGQLSA